MSSVQPQYFPSARNQTLHAPLQNQFQERFDQSRILPVAGSLDKAIAPESLHILALLSQPFPNLWASGPKQPFDPSRYCTGANAHWSEWQPERLATSVAVSTPRCRQATHVGGFAEKARCGIKFVWHAGTAGIFAAVRCAWQPCVLGNPVCLATLCAWQPVSVSKPFVALGEPLGSGRLSAST